MANEILTPWEQWQLDTFGNILQAPELDDNDFLNWLNSVS